MSLDSRGMRRGGCTEYGCLCTGYDGGMEMKKCINCLHPPGKHQKLSNAGSVGSTSYASTAHSMGSHTQATPYSFGGDFHSKPVVATTHHYHAGGSVSSYQPSHIHYHHQPIPQPQLPLCEANGCYKPVHCDPSLPEGLRVFAYCSPECRDRHLLPMEQVNLTVDLSNMKKKLQEVAAAEKRSPSSTVLQRQSSSEYSSRPAGSSSSGVGHVLGGYSSGSKAMYSSSSTPVGDGLSSSSRVTNSSSISGGGSHRTSAGVTSQSSTLAGTQNGHVLGGSDKKSKEQKTTVLSHTKRSSEPFGVLLSKRLHHVSDKAFGFVIIGATYGSPAHTLLQNGKIRIFDVIMSVNEKTCSELLIPAKVIDPQFCFDHHLRDRPSVKLLLSHSISLPPISDQINKAFRAYTHLIALRHSSDCSERAYGLTLNSDAYKILVGGRTTDTPADDSGIQVNDEVEMYAMVSMEAIGDVKEIMSSDDGLKLCKKFDEAQSAKKSVILMIWRSHITRV